MERAKKQWQEDLGSQGECNNKGNSSEENGEAQRASLTKSRSMDEVRVHQRGGFARTRSGDGMTRGPQRGSLARSRSGDGLVAASSRARRVFGDAGASSRARLLVASRGWESFTTRNLKSREEDEQAIPPIPARPSLLNSGAKNWESYRDSQASSRALMLLQSKGSESFRNLNKYSCSESTCNTDDMSSSSDSSSSSGLLSSSCEEEASIESAIQEEEEEETETEVETEQAETTCAA
mmetsp:Transcript_17668/g.33511  ORF Transcript_17668/g.33511 Transcript_17668/m.33511 type:complete len:237 (+) Transcript_17668:127-837(+)|eukprot:scaffold8649_cov185-Amphora_coffeaeformis.AAC.3